MHADIERLVRLATMSKQNNPRKTTTPSSNEEENTNKNITSSDLRELIATFNI
jgi:hypothetical protein